MKQEQNNKTDWTEYYSNKTSIFSKVTQKFTLKIIIDSIKNCIKQDTIDIMELGGGNSCFATEVCNQVNINKYDIIDNNELAVELFNNKNLNSKSSVGKIIDLTTFQSITDSNDKYDFVYSIGLIEHFNKEDRNKVIQNHFNFCKQNGYVFISFPTPTKKYLFFRKCMEKLGVWKFYDETPLIYTDVEDTLKKSGKVISGGINKKLPLSQMIVIAKKI